MVRTHLYSTFYCTREALKVMIPRRTGRIINLGSIAATTGLPFASHYCAAKGGIVSFTKSLAREVVGHGILVNCIAPGFIETPMTAPIPPEVRQQVIAITPIGRFGEPREIAATALFLACEDSSFMVGQVLSPNGGYVI
jgi:3-oxoacyl-[acyl-carrier protein] reductase